MTTTVALKKGRREVIVTDLKTHTIHTNTIKPVNTQESFRLHKCKELASHQQRLEIKRGNLKAETAVNT